MIGVHSRVHWKVVCKSNGKEHPYMLSGQCEVSYGQLTGTFFFSYIHLKSSPSWTTALSFWRDLCNSMMLLAMLCRATQGWQVIMESYDKMAHGKKEWQTIRVFFPWEPMKVKVKVNSLSPVQLSATPWTITYQAHPSMGFSRQEYWSGMPLPSPNNYL